MNNALQVLTDLSIDPFLLNDFLRDPGPLCEKTGLALEDIQGLVRPNEPARGQAWARCAILCAPGEDPVPEHDLPPSPDEA